MLCRVIGAVLDCGTDIIVDASYNDWNDVEVLAVGVKARGSVTELGLTDVDSFHEHYAKKRTGVLPGELVVEVDITGASVGRLPVLVEPVNGFNTRRSAIAYPVPSLVLGTLAKRDGNVRTDGLL